MKSYKLYITDLWYQPEVGMKGYIYASFSSGENVALCSYEKWILGNKDSLRKSLNITQGEFAHVKFHLPKLFHYSNSKEELIQDKGNFYQQLQTPKNFN